MTGADGVLALNMSTSGDMIPRSAQCTCDGFPSIEVYQYKNGTVNTLLKQGARSTVRIGEL